MRALLAGVSLNEQKVRNCWVRKPLPKVSKPEGELLSEVSKLEGALLSKVSKLAGALLLKVHKPAVTLLAHAI